MKDTPFSTIEKDFLKKALAERKRLDGRHFDEQRRLVINFGKDFGCCHVTLGETRVLAQVTSEIQQPKATRPNEGHVFINVEFSPMSASHVEPGKPSDACIIVTRVLEKCIRESKCIDLESLCITAEEKVWALRVNLTILNIEGNVTQCASIAALVALAHYRRPDITSTGDRLIIHDASDKEPLQTALHHFPICLTYAIFNKGRRILADPSLIEEDTAEATLNVGMNAYRELCGIHLGGNAIKDYNSVLKAVQKAGASAAEIVQLIKQRLAEDEQERSKNEAVGLSACIRGGKITTLCDQKIKVRINSQSIQETAEKLIAETRKNKRKIWDEDGNEQEIDTDNKIIVSIGENSAELQEEHDNEMSSDNDTDEEEEEEEAEANDEEEVIDEKVSDKLVVNSPNLNKSQVTKQRASSSKKNFGKDQKNPNPKKQIKKGKKVSQSEVELTITDESDDDLQVVQELTKEEKERMKKVETLVLDDSEEEETSTLTSGELENPKNKPKATPDSSKRKRKNRNKNQKKNDLPARSTSPGSRQWYAKSAW